MAEKESKQAEKVSNAEYVEAGTKEAAKAEPSDALHTLAKAGDVNAQRELGRIVGAKSSALGDKGWKVGQPAPSTKYLDSDGETVLDEPKFKNGNGVILIQEGDQVTDSVLRKLDGV